MNRQIVVLVDGRQLDRSIDRRHHEDLVHMAGCSRHRGEHSDLTHSLHDSRVRDREDGFVRTFRYVRKNYPNLLQSTVRLLVTFSIHCSSNLTAYRRLRS